MNTMQRIHRTANLVVATALAVGIMGTAATTPAAFAYEGFSDLTASPVYQGTFVAGQRDVVPIVVENKDRTSRRVFSLKVMVSKGFQNIVVRPGAGGPWQCEPMTVNPQSGVTTIMCETEGLEADSHKTVLVSATARDVRDLWMVAVVDPQNRVMESNDENNVGKKNLSEFPAVNSSEYHDSGYRPNG